MTGSNSEMIDGSKVMGDPDRLVGRLMQRAWTRDGVVEIIVGLFFLLLSGLLEAQHLLERAWPIFRAIPLLVVPILIGGYLIRWAIRWIRGRYLIERTGYVAFKPVSKKKRIRMALFAGILATISVAAIGVANRAHISSSSQWVLIGTAVLLGVLGPVGGRELRFVFIGVVIAATGILLGIYNVGYDPGWTILYGVAGAILAISGAVVLIRYLRETREAGD